MATNNGWFDVTVEKPLVGELVLVAVEFPGSSDLTHQIREWTGVSWLERKGGMSSSGVKYWRKLPPLPK
jgi:hypothetical protein